MNEERDEERVDGRDLPPIVGGGGVTARPFGRPKKEDDDE